MPWPVVAAIAMELLRRDQLETAMWMMVAFATCLRSSECRGPRRIGVIPPALGVSQDWSLLIVVAELAGRTKTGGHDDSVLLDGHGPDSLGKALQLPVEGPRKMTMWSFTDGDLTTAWDKTCRTCDIKAVP